MNRALIDLIDRAFLEDMPFGDITTDTLIPVEQENEAVLTAKESGVIAGISVADQVFARMDGSLWIESYVADGDRVQPGDVLMRVRGCASSLLKAERTALNLLQHLSGVATETRKFVDAIAGTNGKIVDTRKTTPGLRQLEKMAVRSGGGFNHRFCLSDAVMIKDNHIVAAGGIGNAIASARKGIPHTMKVEVEVESLTQLNEALEAGADIIMLDNMDPEVMTQAVNIVNGRAITEASGGVRLDTVRRIAETGVDVISVGAITHSAPNLDISMKLKSIK